MTRIDSHLQPGARKEPLSTDSHAFRATVMAAFRQGQELLVLCRRCRAGGATIRYVIRDEAGLDRTLGEGHRVYSYSVFFGSAFAESGVVDEAMLGRVSRWRLSEKSFALAIDMRPTDEEPELVRFVSTPDLVGWLRGKSAARVSICRGWVPFWKRNCASVVTAYIPDSDGVARPGAY